jgi:hypothetical protein
LSSRRLPFHRLLNGAPLGYGAWIRASVLIKVRVEMPVVDLLLGRNRSSAARGNHADHFLVTEATFTDAEVADAEVGKALRRPRARDREEGVTLVTAPRPDPRSFPQAPTPVGDDGLADGRTCGPR